MPLDPTEYYGLKLTEQTEAMSDFEAQINANLSKIEGIPAPPEDTGSLLPTSGDFEVGDRIYFSPQQSIYILICKDQYWGWHWRPVHYPISPWVTPPDPILAAGWTKEKITGKPLQLALDYRGNCHWRGTVGTSSGTIPQITSIEVFRPLPLGFRPRMTGVYQLGHETLAVSDPALNQVANWQGARLSLPDTIRIDAGNTNTIRAFGGTAEFSTVHLSNVSYAIGTERYTSV